MAANKDFDMSEIAKSVHSVGLTQSKQAISEHAQEHAPPFRAAVLDTPVKPLWCPGCGNYGILTALKGAFAELNISPENIFIATGIGCGSQIAHYIKAYAVHSLHGRALPVATGAKLANNKLTVLAIGGDGDGYGIGTCHYIHTMRRNIDMTYIVQNNQIYGLTKGQTSPTSDKGTRTITTPHGVIEIPVNPIASSIAAGATFVARGFAGDIMHLKELIVQGIKHKGISHIDVFQPCVTFNKINTYDWFRKRVYKLDDKAHNPSDKMAALAKAFESGDKIPIGVFYKIDKPTYEDELPQIKNAPLAKHPINKINIDKEMEEFV